ncbi:hypothetical protein DFH07DRAFT_776434 [Mycena maculata]|uniref:Uncharacterized protein n=1 Tax=Mycena maculata TaxID=230809 RepID=A0AAD7IMD3_9AGAR|nr:hypothetical protein DFH07DRAFT_776434 [Mycena maculata]
MDLDFFAPNHAMRLENTAYVEIRVVGMSCEELEAACRCRVNFPVTPRHCRVTAASMRAGAAPSHLTIKNLNGFGAFLLPVLAFKVSVVFKSVFPVSIWVEIGNEDKQLVAI